MKKKLIIFMLAIISVFSCIIGLSACILSDDNIKCEHNYEYVSIDDSQHSCLCLKCGDTYTEPHSFNGKNVCTKCGKIKDNGQSESNFKTVSLNPNGGELNNSEEIQTQDFEVGKLMTELPAPVRDGYTFICWGDIFGTEYDSTTLMPNENLVLYAQWQKIITTYNDNYVSFKPATEGVKDSLINSMYRGEVDKFVYVELTSDELGGVDRVGVSNNFTLRTVEGMEYSVKSGYSWVWYEGNFNTPNGAQRFSLKYGSNIQFVTISDNSGVVVMTYLVDIYVKHDYYISLYTDVFAAQPYDKVRVIENERFSAKTDTYKIEGFEFDKRVYYNNDTHNYESFIYSTAINHNWNLYQTYKPVTITTELDGGTAEPITITPYIKNIQLPKAEKEGNDFIGWQLENGKYFADVTGFTGINYLSEDNNFTSLKAIYAPVHFYYAVTEEDEDTQAIFQSFKTVPIVTYTDESKTEILEIYYTVSGTDCALPTVTPQEEGKLFKYWRYCDTDGIISKFDFNQKITKSAALFPLTEEATYFNSITGTTTYYNAVPLNEKKTFTTEDIENNKLLRMNLPTDDKYVFTISTAGNVSFTVRAYGSNSAKTYKATSSPITINLQYVSSKNITYPNGGYVTIEITNCTANFTTELKGATAKTSGEPVELTDNNSCVAGEEISINLRKIDGYIFGGWYNGETLLTNELTYTFEMPVESVTYTAKWIYYTVTTDTNLSEAGTYTKKSDAKTTVGSTVTLTASTNTDYEWLGWYDDDNLLTKELTYTFEMPKENVKYTAKWGYGLSIFNYEKTDNGITITALKNETVSEIVIPDSVTVINSNAFSRCNWLTNVTIGNGVTSIGGSAFNGCSGLMSITIPGNVASIGSSAFNNCSSLSSVTIPDSVTFIGESAFYNTAWYNNQPDGLVYAGKVLYKYKGTMPDNTSITIKEKTNSISAWAFKKCIGLVNVIIPDSVTSIGSRAFYGCNGLTSITIPGSVASIGYNAFYGCDGLMSVTIDDGVTSIDEKAFEGCSGLKNITIPDSVTSIGWYAFSGCNSLQYNEFDNALYLGNTVNPYIVLVKAKNTKISSCIVNNKTKYIYDGAFNGCSVLKSITISDSVTYIPRYSFDYCSGFESITVSENNQKYKSVNNCLLTKDGKTLILGCKNSVIPDSVTSICNGAFYGCSGLTSITIPGNVTSIGGSAFEDCSGLTSITIPGNVTSIDWATFRDCSGLTSVTIPDSVTHIDGYAFYRCSSLTSITFNGTMTQWNAIKKDSDWGKYTGNYTIHCTDGDISK